MKKIIKIIACATLFFQHINASSSSSASINNILGQSRAEFTPITIAAGNLSLYLFRRDLELSYSKSGFTVSQWYQVDPIIQEAPRAYRVQTAFDPWDKSVYAVGIIKNRTLVPYVKPRYGSDFHGKSTWVINRNGSDVVQ